MIDVNSGSFRGKGIPHDQLAFLINKDAAREIARQIRLRGIGGIIMIDFIDMEKKEEKEKLLRILRQEVRDDHVKTVVCGMTSLGLVEMTRKRTTKRLWQYYYDTCPLCKGTGRILSARVAADRILEDTERPFPERPGNPLSGGREKSAGIGPLPGRTPENGPSGYPHYRRAPFQPRDLYHSIPVKETI